MFKRGVIGISYLWGVHIFCGDIFYTFAGVYIEISLIKILIFRRKILQKIPNQVTAVPIVPVVKNPAPCSVCLLRSKRWHRNHLP
jgi:hypothetical protein